MSTFKDLIVYQKAFELSMIIYEFAKTLPPEEKYGLRSQVIRSSRSVCSNIAEGYRKRQYTAHFIAKISDADMENTETIVWLDFALACSYIDMNVHKRLIDANSEVGKLLGHMLKYPERYCPQELSN